MEEKSDQQKNNYEGKMNAERIILKKLIKSASVQNRTPEFQTIHADIAIPIKLNRIHRF